MKSSRPSRHWAAGSLGPRWLGAGLLLLAASSAAGLVHARPPGGDISRVVIPDRGYPAAFAHGPHLASADVASSPHPCAVCHPDAAASVRPTDELRPSPGTCSRCHPVAGNEAASAGWSATHPPWARATREDPPARAEQRGGGGARLRFSHRLHEQQPCERCHAVRAATGRPYLEMRRCRACHAEERASVRCVSCHPGRPGGQLATRFERGAWFEFGPPPGQRASLRLAPPAWVGEPDDLLMPSGSLVGARHGWRWAEGEHAAVAATAPSFCAHCHADGWCRDCHASRVQPLRVHPAGWRAEHGLSSRAGGADCHACHRSAQFCRPCHQRSGVVARGEPTPAPFASTGRFHPTGWAAWTRGPEHHARYARRQLAACAACHQEGTCVRCHATTAQGGGGFSPHSPPVGSRCRRLLRAARRACVQCHGGELNLRPECR